MLANLSVWHLLALLLLGVFIFGPDKLPRAVADAARMLRTLRGMARDATGDLSRQLGTDITVEDLNPRTFVHKHLLSDDDQQALLRPFTDLATELQDTGTALDANLSGLTTPLAAATSRPTPAAGHGRARFDVDTT